MQDVQQLILDDALSQPFWEAVANGSLTFQRCPACSHSWLPARGECPRCLAAEPDWERASGSARLVSWTVYHTAYHPAFVDRLPYNVAIVELTEGPRMISNLVDVDDPETLRIGQSLQLVIQKEGLLSVPRFRCE